MGLARQADSKLESLICNPDGFGSPIGPPLGPHWPLVQPIGPILPISAGFFGVPRLSGLDFSRFVINFASKTVKNPAQIHFKINFFNMMFKDWCEIRKFEKRRKNTGFS